MTQYKKRQDIVYQHEKANTTESDVLRKLLKLNLVLDNNMESFDGNVLNDHYLIALFMRAVDSKVEGFLGK